MSECVQEASVPRGWATSLKVERRVGVKTEYYCHEDLSGVQLHWYVDVSDRRAVVNALREGFNEVRCAFSSGPEREWIHFGSTKGFTAE